ncbi:HNH endonuclease signature motif containing protein [Brachybacterium sp. ACRRE]|uniref:HNH endonuclease n=1 Tax=Brachybacterium sp. ACRRE TaxID=2918184 RepID=UPI001EF2AAEF|nr:HNH endonuclease signature motif containing protein [Brachybacterium sp. ACRRE]MCG7308409.1 HNH endonuclease [Brachybacterium sp. ACRRE]
MDDEDLGAHGATAPGTDGTAARPDAAPARPRASSPSSSISLSADGAVLLRPSSDGRAIDARRIDAPTTDARRIDLRETASAIADAALADAALVGPALDGSGTREAADLSRVLVGIDEMRSALAALEMRTMSALDEAIRAQDVREGLPVKDQGRRTAGEIQMASRVSPATASRRLRAGQRMSREMPRMFEALARGTMQADAGFAIGRSVGPVEPELRGHIDEVLAEHLPDLDGSTPARWSQEVGALAQRLDPRGGPERHRRAATQRGVTVTPGAHGMGTVTAVLPGPDCAAIRRKLALAAESLQVQGDERTHGQLMADLFADTLLGRDETMDPVHFAINVVISERSLFTPTHGEPAVVEGYGLVEATQVRDHVLDQRFPERRTASGRPLAGSVHEQGAASGPEHVHGAVAADGTTGLGAGHDRHSPGTIPRRQTLDIIDIMRRDRGAPPLLTGEISASEPPPRPAPVPPNPPSPAEARSTPSREQIEHDLARFEQQMGDSLRRVFTHPTTGELIAMDSRSRAFPEGLKLYMRLRDVSCVGPYCGAPIRHADHIRPVAEGGPTSVANGQGLCAHCNLTKEALGRVEHVPSADGSHHVTWTSRLGATATVTPPSLTGLAHDPAKILGSASASAGGGAVGDADPAACPDAANPVRSRRHLRMLVEGEDLPARDPYADLSPEDEDRMTAAAFVSFGADDEVFEECGHEGRRFVDECEILEELDRLDALGRPDEDLGALRDSA